MPNFATFTKTTQGLALDNKLAFAGASLELTHLAVGSGVWPGGTDPSALTALAAETLRVAVGEPVARGDGSFEVHGVLSNLGLAQGFDWQECGVFATDPDQGEILYMVTHVEDPAQADYIPAHGGSNLVELDFTFLIRSAAGVQVTAVLQDTLVIATKRDVENHARLARLTALTGGGAGALDAIPWGECADNELAVVEPEPNEVCLYRFHKSSMAEELAPEVIRPDNAGDNPGRWLRAAAGQIGPAPVLAEGQTSEAITTSGTRYAPAGALVDAPVPYAGVLRTTATAGGRIMHEYELLEAPFLGQRFLKESLDNGLTWSDWRFTWAGWLSPVEVGLSLWVERANPKNSVLEGVVYGNGLFVAVGYSYVVTSTDGITWTEQTLPRSMFFLNVAYGAGTFVAVGLNEVGSDAFLATSPDGITWTERANPQVPPLYDVAYGNGLFVAVGYPGSTTHNMITSSDGMTWTVRTNPKKLQLNGVTYGNGLFVAVGVSDSTDAYIITSPDGVTWTERANPKPQRLVGVTYGNGLFVAVGAYDDATDTYLLTSPDGITWTERANPIQKNLSGVAYGNGHFVAVGNYQVSGASLLTSPDGITWTERAVPKDAQLLDVCYGNGCFVAVGENDGTDAYIVTPLPM